MSLTLCAKILQCQCLANSALIKQMQMLMHTQSSPDRSTIYGTNNSYISTKFWRHAQCNTVQLPTEAFRRYASGRCDRKGGNKKNGDAKKDCNNENGNLAAVLHGVEDLRLEDRPIPEINDEEVLLAMDTVGICGTDVHFYKHGRIGDFVVKKPMVTGHESSAVVEKVGKNVKTLKKGDRVAIEPGLPCRKCDLCKAGRYNLCPHMIFCSLPPVDGVLQRYFKHAPDFCFKLPDNVSMEEGALMEPLAVAVHSCRRGGVRLGSHVLVLGSGPVGFATVVTAKAMGASKILVIDINEDLLNMAMDLGATACLVVDPEEKPEHLAKRIVKHMGCEPNKTIDCCGFESAIRTGVFATKSGGQFVVAGLGFTDVKVPLLTAMAKQVDILCAFLYCNDFPAALAMVSSGEVNIKQIITHHFAIEDAVEAFQMKTSGEGAIKVMVHVQPKDTNNEGASSNC